MKVRAVTGYVPLDLVDTMVDGYHTTPEVTKELGAKLIEACEGKITVFDDFPWKKCWLAKEDPPLRCSLDKLHWFHKFKNDEDYARWAIVCNQLVEWGAMAAAADPSVDIWVSFTYTIMKQGAFTKKIVEAEHIREFLKRLKTYDRNDIPFPGIEPIKPVNNTGYNWRFTGSTHIWPAKWLPDIRHAYRKQVHRFLKKHERVPLDLMIWPEVERLSGLPFRWYKADYDYTQMTNFPGY